MAKCFNGHDSDQLGCEGCHHRFHVLAPGDVRGGGLVQPVVNGPEDCELCHKARHADPDPACPRCRTSSGDRMIQAVKGAAPVREEIMQLEALHWLLGWRASLAGILGFIGGGALLGEFSGSTSRPDLVRLVVGSAMVPLGQWVIRRAIRSKQKQLPRLSPEGEVVYGEPDSSPSDRPPFS